MERYEAHRILTEHAPERDRRWLWLRWRCADCRQRYPCTARDEALAELAAGIPVRYAPTPRWLRLFGRRPFLNRDRW